MATLISEEEVGTFKGNDISIQTLPNGKNLLILICESKEDSNRLIELLTKNLFKLGVSIEANGNYAITIQFVESEYDLKLVTEKTKDNYPPVKKLHDNQVAFLTTGIWTDRSAQGRNCEYHTQMLRLSELNISEALSQAQEVHFIAGEKGKTPSTIVLIFENWDHVAKAEAVEAYNKLMHQCKANPTLEIRKTDTTVSLKIWDILVDLEITLTNLKYFTSQLNEFIEATDSKDSFVFVIGLPPENDCKVALIASKREGEPQFITLKGYVYKSS